jgi:hypothetical protein
MRAVKAVVKVLYFSARMPFLPLLFLFRPARLRPESIVVTSTVALFILVVQPIATTWMGFGYAIAVPTKNLI